MRKLIKKSLMYKTTNINYGTHGLIKDCFYKRLGKQIKKENHLFAAGYYEKEDNDYSIIEALYHFTKARESEKVCAIIVKNVNKLINNGHATNIENILREFKEKDIPKQYLSKILLIKGKTNYILGKCEKAEAHFKMCIEVEKQDSIDKSIAYRKVGLIKEENSKWKNALEYYKKSLESSERSNDKYGIVEANRAIGNLYFKTSSHHISYKYFNNSLEIAKSINHHNLIGKIYYDMGNYYNFMKNYDKALEYLKQSLNILREYNEYVELGKALNALGDTYFKQKNWEKALEYYEKSVKNCDEIGFIREKGNGLLKISECFIENGKFDRVSKCLDMAFKLAKNIKDQEIIAYYYYLTGKMLRLQNNWVKSKEYLDKSMNISIQLAIPSYVSKINFELGKLKEAKIGIS